MKDQFLLYLLKFGNTAESLSLGTINKIIQIPGAAPIPLVPCARFLVEELTRDELITSELVHADNYRVHLTSKGRNLAQQITEK